MVVSRFARRLAPHVPVVGSAYGFGRTCIRVYNATSPTKAIIAGVKNFLYN